MLYTKKNVERILMKITLRLNQAIQAIKIKVSRIIHDKPMCTSFIVKQ